jgi:TrmH family RNA methyltransferase
MLSKKEIKDIQSLGHKKFRTALKLFLAEGPKIVRELYELIPQQVEKIYATTAWIKANQDLASQGTVMEVTEDELEKISQLHTPNEVLAVIRQFEYQEPPASTFTLYLDTIQDPGNLGTIIRIADWFGVKQVVCSAGCADLYNPKVVQSTMASIARVSVYYDENNWLAKQEVPIYAAVLEGESVYKHQGTGQGVLIIGNESKGIGPEVLKYATHKVTIPKPGQAESLNAAVATGIILSHLLN